MGSPPGPWALILQEFDPFSSLMQFGALGIFAACLLAAVIALWRREARTLDLERKENAQLREEIKELNAELRGYLAQRPRAESLITRAAERLKETDDIPGDHPAQS